MAATTATEIGDLLFRNFDQHVDRTIHHSATIEKPNNFKDALEMYCYRNKIHKLQNPAALLYMIMGYLSTYPRKKRIGVKNIFLSRDEEMIKVLAQYTPAKAKNSVDLSPFYRAFVIHINPTTPPKRLDINDYESMEKILSISNQNPYGYKSALKSALERVQYIVIKRPRIGTVYSVLTDEGTKMYLANKATPFVVETESAPLAATRDSIYKPYAMLLAYSGDQSMQVYSFKNAEISDNRVSFVLKRNHLTSGVAIHILEDPIDGSSTGTYLAPDYHEIEKQLNNEQAKRSIEILSNMEQFQIHAAPSLKSCEPIKSLNICMNGVKEVENNVANFTRLGNFYSRTWPDTPNNFRVICADAGHKRQRLYPRLEYTIESWLSQGKTPKNEKLALECYSSEALFDSNLKKGTKAFLKAASGNDTIIGFRDRSNIISFAGGRKYFVGGAESDTFILHGEDVAMGFLDGGIGSDVLDFSKYAKKELQIQFYNGYKTAHILVVSGTNYRLDIDNIENFVGRPDAQDKMVTNCRTSFVDLQGGTEQLSDLINILQSQDQFCEYRLAVALWHNTHVMNQACSGTFSYELNKDSKSGLVYLKNYCKGNSTAQSIVKINMPLRAVSKMQRLVDDEQHQLEIQFEN
uniref:Uncharacterized protein n=1 Tax=Romanomermis culicivorax TaxID=13658 RepID=A0A915JXG2_ROMCU